MFCIFYTLLTNTARTSHWRPQDMKEGLSLTGKITQRLGEGVSDTETTQLCAYGKRLKRSKCFMMKNYVPTHVLLRFYSR
jgi:hypothetical protein